jgi:hypothetical protein
VRRPGRVLGPFSDSRHEGTQFLAQRLPRGPIQCGVIPHDLIEPFERAGDAGRRSSRGVSSIGAGNWNRNQLGPTWTGVAEQNTVRL